MNNEFIIKAADSYATLFEYAKKHHEYSCDDCEGTGKIYKHADPTSGQWVECPVYKLIQEAQP